MKKKMVLGEIKNYVLIATLFFIVLLTMFFFNQEKFGEMLIAAVTTFFAAWAGGWAAFENERKTREDAKNEIKVSCANKAIFVISAIYGVCNELKKQIILPNSLNEDIWLSMPTLNLGMIPVWKFNFEELSFLLEAGTAQAAALQSLMTLENSYRLLWLSIEERNKAIEDLNARITNNHPLELDASFIKVMHSDLYEKLNKFTGVIEKTTDTCLDDGKRVYEILVSALLESYTDSAFIKINFS